MALRWLAAAILALFVAYTLYAAGTESFWKSCRIVLARRWGRQVVADLYIGLLLFTCLVYWHEQSVFWTAVWLVPTLIFGNITTLAYVVLNFESLATHLK
jgi:hypothetical protein